MYTTEEEYPGLGCNWFKRSLRLIIMVILSLAGPGAVFADEVTDWNQHTLDVILTAKASSIATMRILAIEQAAVFDAVNGIERRFTHIYVKPDGPRRASARAAAIQAAYATLIRFFPGQKADLDAHREASLSAITEENPNHIRQGIDWGQRVADEILAARCGDNVTFTHGSDTLAGVTRTHASFSAAAEEANESRIFTGAHFRSSCNDGQEAGAALGSLIVSRLARPNHEKDHNLSGMETNQN